MGSVSLELSEMKGMTNRNDFVEKKLSFSVLISFSDIFYFLFSKLKLLELTSFFIQTAQFFQNCTFCVELNVNDLWQAPSNMRHNYGYCVK